MNTTTIDRSNDVIHLQSKELLLRPRVMLAAGVLAIGSAWILAGYRGNDWSRLTHAYLTSVCYFLSISLGGLFFTLLQHLTGARWSVVIRRLAELTTVGFPMLALLMVPLAAQLLAGDSALYEWNDATLRASDQLIQAKAPYLNAPFFTIRCAGYFGVWILLSHFYLSHSVRQDSERSSTDAEKMRRYSGPAMIAFGLTTNFAAFDLLMTLDSHWFSTIFGVYYFAGCVVGILAILILAANLLQHAGYLKNAITLDHYHDLGKLLFGFTFFWAYIAFSQYLLIWYANIPEETGWFLVRQSGGWQFVSLLLIVGHFFLPFCGLMSRSARRDRRKLVFWSVFLLAMHWIDLFWLVMPSVSPDSVPLGIIELLCLLGVGALWFASVLWKATTLPLLPKGDPHLRESLNFHNP